jgi:hypothetical protein
MRVRFKEPHNADQTLEDIRYLLYIQVCASSGFDHDRLVEEFIKRRTWDPDKEYS